MAKIKSELMGGAAMPGAKAPASPRPTPPTEFSPDQVTHFEAPELFASAVQVTVVANDINVTFSAPRMAFANVDGSPVQASTMIPSSYVTMSAGTAKDLLLSLQIVMEQYEKEYGVVETAFSRTNDKK